MKGNPIWNSFAAGELSPRFFARSDTKPWRNGVAKLLNCFCTSHGPVVRRSGLQYLGSSDANEVNIIGYPYLANRGYYLCISDVPEVQIYNVSSGVAPVLEQTLATPWLTGQVENIQFDAVPGETALFVAQPDHPPQEFVFDPDAAVGSQWSIQPIAITGAPADWATSGYPGAIAFFEGRLWLAGTDGNPETLWSSKSGDFRDFQGDSTPASDPLELTLSTSGRIQWLGATQNLVVGTVNGEHVLTSQGGVITEADVQARQQSSYGSLATMAQLIGNVVLYISPDGRKLRDVGYRWEENNWLSRDITFLSEHITFDNNLKEVTWAQNPNNSLWAVTNKGTIVGCTYERHYDVIGWHRHTTQGSVKGLHSIDVKGVSTLMVGVQREDGKVYFELYSQPEDDAERPVYLDSHLVFTSPGNTITLPHLPNATVSVTVDGATHPDVVLDASGVGALQYTGERVEAGLSYPVEVTTLPMDYTPEEQGTSQHMSKRWSKIFVRMLDSATPLINGERPDDRTPSTPMGSPEPYKTKDFKVVNLGYDQFAQITISQDLPVPFTVAGIFGELGFSQIGG